MGAAAGRPAGFGLLLQQGSPSIKPAREVLFEDFAGESFDRLDGRTQSLLLRTALLPQFTAAMAAALGEEPEAAAVLERLQQGAHFLLCRPGSEAIYEFHPLYREYLLARSRRDLSADLLAALRGRGGDLLTQAGEVEQAAELFRESGNEEALSRLVLVHGPQLAREGRHEVLKAWLARLGENRIQDTPWLLYWRGIARLYSDRSTAALDFQQAYRAFRRDDADVMGLYMSWLGVLQTYQLDWFKFSTLDWWIKEFFELRRRHPDYPRPELEIELLSLSACLWYGQPRNPDLRGLSERAFELFHACTDPGQRLLLAHNVSLCCAFSGDLARDRYLVETLDPPGDFSGMPPFAVNAWHFAAAMHGWMVGRARDCLEIVDTALPLSRSTGMHAWDFLLYAQGAYASRSLWAWR